MPKHVHTRFLQLASKDSVSVHVDILLGVLEFRHGPLDVAIFVADHISDQHARGHQPIRFKGYLPRVLDLLHVPRHSVLFLWHIACSLFKKLHTTACLPSGECEEHLTESWRALHLFAIRFPGNSVCCYKKLLSLSWKQVTELLLQTHWKQYNSCSPGRSGVEALEGWTWLGSHRCCV